MAVLKIHICAKNEFFSKKGPLLRGSLARLQQRHARLGAGVEEAVKRAKAKVLDSAEKVYFYEQKSGDWNLEDIAQPPERCALSRLGVGYLDKPRRGACYIRSGERECLFPKLCSVTDVFTQNVHTVEPRGIIENKALHILNRQTRCFYIVNVPFGVLVIIKISSSLPFSALT